MDNSVLLTTVAIAALIYIDPDWEANPAFATCQVVTSAIGLRNSRDVPTHQVTQNQPILINPKARRPVSIPMVALLNTSRLPIARSLIANSCRRFGSPTISNETGSIATICQ